MNLNNTGPRLLLLSSICFCVTQLYADDPPSDAPLFQIVPDSDFDPIIEGDLVYSEPTDAELTFWSTRNEDPAELEYLVDEGYDWDDVTGDGVFVGSIED